MNTAPIPESFEELPSTPSAVMDFSCLRLLLDPQIVAFLDGSSPEYDSFRKLWTKLLGKGGPQLATSVVLSHARDNGKVAAALSLLDRIICHEYLIIDAVTLDDEFHNRRVTKRDLEMLQKRLPFVAPLIVPSTIYEAAADTIRSRRTAIESLKKLLSYSDFDAGDKAFHDGLHRTSRTRLYSFADSGDVPERAVFYGLVASAAQVPLIVSPNKEYLLKKLGHIIHQTHPNLFDVHAQIVRAALDTATSDDIHDTPGAIPFQVPPLAESILISALADQESLFTTLHRVRSTPEARAYRAFVFELEKALRGSLPMRAKAIAVLKELRTHVREWAVDPKLGLEYIERVLKLDELPIVGWVFAVGGAGEKKVMDPIFDNPAAHLRFISGWFKPLETA